MTQEPDQTRRCNEPEWEPKEIKWHRPGATPEPGLYWFDGHVYFGDVVPSIEGTFAVLILDDEWTVGVNEEAVGFKAKIKDLFGEWFGPFEHSPDFGDAMLEVDTPTEEGEVGDGI